MNPCQQMEEKLSTVLDGECPRRDFAEILSHTLHCPSCREFFEDGRALQMRLISPENATEEPKSSRMWEQIALKGGLKRRSYWTKFRKLWPVIPGIAAAIFIALTLWGLSSILSSQTASTPSEPIALEGQRGSMTEPQFVDMVRDLIQSDRKYQLEMLRVMREVVQVYPEHASEEGALTEESSFSREDSSPTRERIGS